MLIFLMISSLANFLMLILYSGLNQRVSWTLLMYTMGAVCVARIAIEQSRQYSIGYLAALAIAAFVVMSRFVVGSVIFCAGILALIAYLSDRIVHDCTLIDDSQDASGQGLIDFGRGQLKRQLQNSASNKNADKEVENSKESLTLSTKVGHQPGRTVMYLAIAALPLFGLGQFLLRSDSATWGSAQKYLAVYLFSSLSLLVTTSFLGLRRYLRQRNVDMPGDVAVAWLAGGLAMIGMILSVAYLAPMPGQALASIQMPEFLTAPKDLQASSMGWGDEGANQTPDDSSSTGNDKETKDKETQGIRQEKGAPPGKTKGGDGKQGPSGNKDGGDKSGGKSAGKKQSPSGPKSSSQSPQKNKGQKGEQQKSSEQKSDGPKSKGQQKPNESPKGEQPSDPSKSSDSKSDQDGSKQSSDKSPEQDPKPSSQQDENAPPGDKQDSESPNKQSDKQSDKESDEEADSDQGDDAKRDSEPEDQPEDERQDENQQDSEKSSQSSKPSEQSDADSSTQKSNSASQSNGGEPPPSSPPSNSSSMGNFFSALGGILRFLVMAGLLAVVVAFVYIYRDAIAAWWDELWNRETAESIPVADNETQQSDPESPPVPFSSFRNPIGSEKDPRKIVVITFQAFEAWTREQGWQRKQNETPSEFIRRVAGSIPTAATPATQIVDAYNRIVYGRGKATRRDLAAAKQVWQAMQA